jgi:hypothetical protein
MSDQWKAEQIKKAESQLTELEKIRTAAVGKMEAAQQAADQARGEVEAAEQRIVQARAELETAKAA